MNPTYDYPIDVRTEAQEAMSRLNDVRLTLDSYCDALGLGHGDPPRTLWRAFEMVCEAKNRVHRILEVLDKAEAAGKEAGDEA